MEILVALGEIYGAERMTPVSSVQIAGVSYDNLGEAGLRVPGGDGGRRGQGACADHAQPGRDGRRELAGAGDRCANLRAQQQRVIDAFARMGVIATCTCTPYLTGNLPRLGRAYRLG